MLQEMSVRAERRSQAVQEVLSARCVLQARRRAGARTSCGAAAGRRGRAAATSARPHALGTPHHRPWLPWRRSMDLESPLPRGYPPPSTAMLFDDDPGIMSEVETSSTGFRRGGKQRSSLPVVRTPSKTLERPLGLVFLQYRSETKRALLPNEITSIDTVKALFVRSFPKQLTMEYLDSPHVKIYIHDSSKDMFYELEDVRSHLRDIRDRSVLRLFESADMNGGVLPGAGVGVMAPSMWDQDQSYFSEPEFDSEYQHQHIHKSKTSSKGGGGSMGQQPYYMTHSYPPGGASQGSAPATLPRGGPLLRAYSPAVVPPVPADRIKTLPQSDKSVSFEKSVSFSDEPPDMNSPKQHSPQHTEQCYYWEVKKLGQLEVMLKNYV
ncbi:Uncharacterized protein GBIM_18116 [Gryllus bimaculatus]|nr:Uncharacterized protein GBIM_18116 [Gryllus bimaculatus]